jgi:hypothetical protein
MRFSVFLSRQRLCSRLIPCQRSSTKLSKIHIFRLSLNGDMPEDLILQKRRKILILNKVFLSPSVQPSRTDFAIPDVVLNSGNFGSILACVWCRNSYSAVNFSMEIIG